MADGTGSPLERLAKSTKLEEQQKLRARLRGASGELDVLSGASLLNPFLKLSDEDVRVVRDEGLPEPLGRIVALRQEALNSSAPRYAVFCMPKSGSSFVQSSLQHALQLPFVSLTSFSSGVLSSYFGMNGREQEIDELAMIKSVLASPQGFVAQHHTRYTQYLALQLKAFGITPIVTLRNILDCLVSFDDMMLNWRQQNPPEGAWVADPYPFPHDFPQRDPADRYRLIGHSLGTWLVQFFVSWKRGLHQQVLEPLVIQYERDILDSERFIEILSQRFGLTEAQHTRLSDYVANPDRELSRLNVGQPGRGREIVPEAVRQMLADYAATFDAEITPAELKYLFG